MSQLKHRIAIGKIIDGEWKFDHYAGYSEYKNLRINKDGAVESAFFGHGDGASGNIYGIVWQDVSDTHRVEWGIRVGINEIYESDILCPNKQPSYQRRMYDIEEIIYELTDGSFNVRDVIGNVNENPELLETGK